MAMSLSQQRRVVAVSSMIVFALGTAARLERGKSFTDTEAARFYIGVGLAFTMVSVFVDLGQEIGAGFALLILIAALLREGNAVFGFIIKRSRTPKEDFNTIGKPTGRPTPPVSDKTHANALAFLQYEHTHPNAIYNPHTNYERLVHG